MFVRDILDQNLSRLRMQFSVGTKAEMAVINVALDALLRSEV